MCDLTVMTQCLVCFDDKELKDMHVGVCGHLLCGACVTALQQHGVLLCPNCRTSTEFLPVEVVMSRISAPAQTTSSKFTALVNLLREIYSNDHREKVVVICPNFCCLKVKDRQDLISHELRNVELSPGVPLKFRMLDGTNKVQQATLRQWIKGGHVLICRPTVKGLNFHQATTMIFLTTLFSDDDLLQSSGRIVRQGNDSVLTGKPVKIYFLIAHDTEEDKPETLERVRYRVSRG